MTAPTSPATLDGLDVETASQLHRTMVRIRVFETRVQELFQAGELPGFVHTCLGQEATAAGVCQVLTDDVLARLMTFNNVVVTSHQAFLTHEALANIADTTLANIEEFEGGKRGAELTNAAPMQ